MNLCRNLRAIHGAIGFLNLAFFILKQRRIDKRRPHIENINDFLIETFKAPGLIGMDRQISIIISSELYRSSTPWTKDGPNTRIQPKSSRLIVPSAAQNNCRGADHRESHHSDKMAHTTRETDSAPPHHVSSAPRLLRIEDSHPPASSSRADGLLRAPETVLAHARFFHPPACCHTASCERLRAYSRVPHAAVPLPHYEFRAGRQPYRSGDRQQR